LNQEFGAQKLTCRPWLSLARIKDNFKYRIKEEYREQVKAAILLLATGLFSAEKIVFKNNQLHPPSHELVCKRIAFTSFLIPQERPMLVNYGKNPFTSAVNETPVVTLEELNLFNELSQSSQCSHPGRARLSGISCNELEEQDMVSYLDPIEQRSVGADYGLQFVNSSFDDQWMDDINGQQAFREHRQSGEAYLAPSEDAELRNNISIDYKMTPRCINPSVLFEDSPHELSLSDGESCNHCLDSNGFEISTPRAVSTNRTSQR
jgi:hypothetical protein